MHIDDHLLLFDGNTSSVTALLHITHCGHKLTLVRKCGCPAWPHVVMWFFMDVGVHAKTLLMLWLMAVGYHGSEGQRLFSWKCFPLLHILFLWSTDSLAVPLNPESRNTGWAGRTNSSHVLWLLDCAHSLFGLWRSIQRAFWVINRGKHSFPFQLFECANLVWSPSFVCKGREIKE